MIAARGCEQFPGREAPRGGRFAPAGSRFRKQRARSSLRRHQLSARHTEVGQREQHVPLRSVLRQAAIAQLDVAELALDHPERVLDLGADARLDVLHLVSDSVLRIGGVDPDQGEVF